MGGYQRLVQRLEARPASADGADARQLERWADEMGDVLESGYLRRADAERVIGRLVQWAVSGTDYAVREAALNAVCQSGIPYQLPYGLLEPLAVHLADFEPRLLEYVLFSLSATHDERAVPVVRPFLAHPDAAVREEAAMALSEFPRVGGSTA